MSMDIFPCERSPLCRERTYKFPPIEDALTRAEFVTGLRLMFPRACLACASAAGTGESANDLSNPIDRRNHTPFRSRDPARRREIAKHPRGTACPPAPRSGADGGCGRCKGLLGVATVLCDVATQFGLADGDIEDVLGEFAERLGRGAPKNT
jgi:hypothetical protein